MEKYNKILKPNNDYLVYTGILVIVIIIGLCMKVEFSAGICLIFALIFIMMYFSQVRKIKKTMKKYEDLEIELSKESTVVYKEANIYLTDKYIVSTDCSCHVFEYNDFIWIYHVNNPYDSYGDTKALFIRSEYFTLEYILTTVKREKVKILDEIMNKVHEKNPEIMIGYTKENSQRYKQIIKDNKELRKKYKNKK